MPTRPPDDAGREALTGLKVHLAECAGRYDALRMRMDFAMAKLTTEMKVLRWVVIAMLAVEVLGIRNALQWGYALIKGMFPLP